MRGTIGVHAAHCCKWHGCKYGDPDCSVENGEVEQEHICEDCFYYLKEEEYYRAKLIEIEDIKRWRASRK